jgi:hypothetical protein
VAKLVTLPDGLGGRHDILLGKHGTTESRIEYARVIVEWEAAGRRLPQEPVARDITISELISVFWRHAEEHYRRPDGTPIKELADYKLTLRLLRHAYGGTFAKDFGPLALKALRQKMINGWEHPEYGVHVPLCRGG